MRNMQNNLNKIPFQKLQLSSYSLFTQYFSSSSKSTIIGKPLSARAQYRFATFYDLSVTKNKIEKFRNLNRKF